MSTLKELKLKDGIRDDIISRHSQPSRLFGLAKVHKKDTLMQPVLPTITLFVKLRSSFLKLTSARLTLHQRVELVKASLDLTGK